MLSKGSSRDSLLSSSRPAIVEEPCGFGDGGEDGLNGDDAAACDFEGDAGLEGDDAVACDVDGGEDSLTDGDAVL